MSVPWWIHPQCTVREALRRSSVSTPELYRFGDATLSLATDFPALSERFDAIYGECGSSAGINLPCVRAEIRNDPEQQLAVVTIARPRPLDACAFFSQLFPDLALSAKPCPDPSWRVFAAGTNQSGTIAFHRDHLVISYELPWQRMVGEFLVGDVMRLQESVMFFHAASVGIANQGVLISGAKGAGKSTLSLGLAARGHAFLGDDLSAVRMQSRVLIPFRRAVSIRSGPRPSGLESRLSENPQLARSLGDGTTRVRAEAGQLFPSAQPREVVLTHAFFLRGFAGDPRVEPFEAEERHLGLVEPLVATTWSLPPARRAVQFMNLLAGVKCFQVHVGGNPDRMTDALENCVR